MSDAAAIEKKQRQDQERMAKREEYKAMMSPLEDIHQVYFAGLYEVVITNKRVIMKRKFVPKIFSLQLAQVLDVRYVQEVPWLSFVKAIVFGSIAMLIFANMDRLNQSLGTYFLDVNSVLMSVPVAGMNPLLLLVMIIALLYGITRFAYFLGFLIGKSRFVTADGQNIELITGHSGEIDDMIKGVAAGKSEYVSMR